MYMYMHVTKNRVTASGGGNWEIGDRSHEEAFGCRKMVAFPRVIHICVHIKRIQFVVPRIFARSKRPRPCPGMPRRGRVGRCSGACLSRNDSNRPPSSSSSPPPPPPPT